MFDKKNYRRVSSIQVVDGFLDGFESSEIDGNICYTGFFVDKVSNDVEDLTFECNDSSIGTGIELTFKCSNLEELKKDVTQDTCIFGLTDLFNLDSSETSTYFNYPSGDIFNATKSIVLWKNTQEELHLWLNDSFPAGSSKINLGYMPDLSDYELISGPGTISVKIICKETNIIEVSVKIVGYDNTFEISPDSWKTQITFNEDSYTVPSNFFINLSEDGTLSPALESYLITGYKKGESDDLIATTLMYSVPVRELQKNKYGYFNFGLLLLDEDSLNSDIDNSKFILGIPAAYSGLSNNIFYAGLSTKSDNSYYTPLVEGSEWLNNLYEVLYASNDKDNDYGTIEFTDESSEGVNDYSDDILGYYFLGNTNLSLSFKPLIDEETGQPIRYKVDQWIVDNVSVRTGNTYLFTVGDTDINIEAVIKKYGVCNLTH